MLYHKWKAAKRLRFWLQENDCGNDYSSYISQNKDKLCSLEQTSALNSSSLVTQKNRLFLFHSTQQVILIKWLICNVLKSLYYFVKNKKIQQLHVLKKYIKCTSLSLVLVNVAVQIYSSEYKAIGHQAKPKVYLAQQQITRKE